MGDKIPRICINKHLVTPPPPHLNQTLSSMFQAYTHTKHINKQIATKQLKMAETKEQQREGF